MTGGLITVVAATACASAVFLRRPRSARQRLPLRAAANLPRSAPGTVGFTTVGRGGAAAMTLLVMHVAFPLALLAGLSPGGVQLVRRHRAAVAHRAACEVAVVEVTFALAGELRAGRTSKEALAAAARAAGPLAAVIQAAAAAVEVGGSAATELSAAARIPGAERLGSVAAAWAVTESAGGRVALVLERLGEAMDRDQELRHEMQAALAAPRATMVMLACLPLFGLGLGQSIGAHPFQLLLHRPIGWALLAGAAVLDGIGVAVSRFITRWALRG